MNRGMIETIAHGLSLEVQNLKHHVAKMGLTMSPEAIVVMILELNSSIVALENIQITLEREVKDADA